MIARLSHHLPRGAYLQQLRAGLSSLNELTVHAVAMETWRAFHSEDGPDGSRNALGQVLFPSNVATRSTRSESTGVVSPHLPYAANTLVDNGIAMWNKFPALREASTKRMASNVAKSSTADPFPRRAMNVSDLRKLNYSASPRDEEEHSVGDPNHFSFYVEGITLTLVSLFGLFGNGLSIIVLLRPSFRNSFSNLLRGLAFCDALFLIIAILSFGFPKLLDWYAENLFIHMTAVMFGLLHTFRVGSVYVTMAVTLERFMAIIFPFRQFRSKKFLLPGALCFAVVYNLPKYFEVETLWDEASQRHTIVSTSLRQNPYYLKYYVIWSKLIITELVPYLTILILNIFIICGTLQASSFRKQFVGRRSPDDAHCQRSRKECPWREEMRRPGGHPTASPEVAELTEHPRELKEILVLAENCSRTASQALLSRQETLQSMTSGHGIVVPAERHKTKSELELVRVLIGISLLFIVCQSLKIIPDLYELFWCDAASGDCQVSDFVQLIVTLSHLLVCVNSSANFLFYFFHGAKFRKAFKDTFFCKAEGRASMNSYSSHRPRTEATV
eukprot:maker-scaffold77_size404793-snap-gene-1.9 protein:Tk04773 transcript:maker-scaffold77_size404793-snap-gene-1.9-mRNA-1 annotation:"GJ13605"